MISAKASAAIDWLFEKSVRDTSTPGPEDHCRVIRKPEMDLPDDAEKRQLVVLNIASYVFRIVALFDFDTDTATTTYLAKMLRSKEAQLKDQALLDAYAEFVNMICGAVNRGLGEAFLAGMSTPFSLKAPARGMCPYWGHRVCNRSKW